MKHSSAMLLGCLVAGVAGVEDTGAPVISLNLEGVTPLAKVQTPTCAYLDKRGQKSVCKKQICHTAAHWGTLNLTPDCTIDSQATPHKTSYARKCAVFSNSKSCPLPKASVFDRGHNDIKHNLETTYTLYLKSDAHKDPVLYKQEESKIDYNQRGEYIVSYDVEDASGNDAETVHFVVIMQDHVKPTLAVKPIAAVESYGNGERYFRKNMYVGLKATDDYDGDVTDVISASYNHNKAAPKQAADGKKALTSGFSVDTSDVGTHYVDYTARDFANIFGTKNKDNFISSRYSFKVQDTLPPTIYCNPVDIVTTPGTFTQKLALSTTTVKTTAECAELCYRNAWDRKPSATPCAYFHVKGNQCSLFGADAKKQYGRGNTKNLQGEVPDCDTVTVVDCATGSFKDAGALCIDLRDSYVSDGSYSKVAIIPQVSGDTVDTGVPKTYGIKYNCEDAHSHVAAEQTRTVVIQDLVRPVLTINGNFPMSYEMEYGSAANSLMMKKFTTAHDSNGFKCVDECTNSGSHISHSVKVQAFEGNCNGEYDCYDENGEVTSCDGGDDNFLVEIEDVLMPGKWGIKYTCTDGTGNIMSKCRTIFNNLGEDDDAAITKVPHPVDVKIVATSTGCTAPTGAAVQAFTKTTLAHQLGDANDQIKGIKATSDAGKIEITLTLDGKCESCNEEIIHLLKNMFIHSFMAQFGAEQDCDYTDIEINEEEVPLPVDCAVSNWAEWTSCSRKCGPGTQQRTRSITQGPKKDGKACPILNDAKDCQITACARSCPSDWFQWSECSKSCGSGIQTREIQARKAARGCPRSQQKICSTNACPVDCHMSGWSIWSPCNKACNSGMQYKHRRIVSQPKNYAPKCKGNLIKHRICNDKPCPVDCKVSPWDMWSPCSQKCGGGIQTRKRTLDTKPANGGKPCPVLSTVRNCNIYKCPAFCGAVWHEWPQCPVNCGRGAKKRAKKYANILPNIHNTATLEQAAHFQCPEFQETVCNYEPCAIDCKVGTWERWGSCDRTCGVGSRSRSRPVIHSAQHGGESCAGQIKEEEWCKMSACPIPCVMSEWVEGGRCSSDCGGGVRSRTRSVLQEAQHGAPRCGTELENVACNTRPCPEDCKVTQWAEWSKCTLSCNAGGGGGVQHRSPTSMENENAHLFGKDSCPTSQTRMCNRDVRCPIDCVWGEWDDWSECSATCGTKGTASRTRTASQLARFGGAPCRGKATIEKNDRCQFPACPMECKMNSWSAWGACSEKCGGDGGGGLQERSRSILQRPSSNMSPCGKLVEERMCNTGPCSIHCSYNWGDWSDCSAACGQGHAIRSIVQQRQQSNECRRNPLKCPGMYGGLKCPKQQQKTCIIKPCPQDCQVSAWAAWEGCTRTCAGGDRRRSRSIRKEASLRGKRCLHLEETEKCNMENCPIDCVVSNWGSYTDCTEICGGGVRTRRRNVLLDTSFAGVPCPPSRETTACNTKPCPVHCVFTAHDWSTCDKSCGDGVQRKRLTIHVDAKYGGNSCPREQERVCKLANCPIDCELGTWSEWSDCSKLCGRGSQSRTRATTVKPRGGLACLPTFHDRKCNTQKCPVNCRVGNFGKWSACSQPCGEGVQKQTRTITTPAQNGGVPCPAKEGIRDCKLKECNVGCAWEEWSACSTTCGLGVQTRKVRLMVHADWECPSSQRVCDLGPCPVDCQVDAWSGWSGCSKTCASRSAVGFKKRTRSILRREELGGAKCPDLTDVADCNTDTLCPVNCVMTDPSEWGRCTRSCGVGSKTRTRTVVTPAQNGGTKCPPENEVQDCAMHACPTNCKVAKWSAWGPCSSVCGGGVRTKSREITESPSVRGKRCPQLQQLEACNSHACPDCNYAFERWGECSKSCGGGMQTRHIERGILSHVATTTQCAVTEERICNTGGCPVDCVWSQWSDYSTCSRTCGGGSQTRTRKFAIKSKHGGVECGDWKEDLRNCNAHACPEDCSVESWSRWTPCTRTCGAGTHQRSRKVVSTPLHGGAACPFLSQSGACNADNKCPVDCKLSEKYGAWGTCSKSCGAGTQRRKKSEIRPAANGGAVCKDSLQTKACNDFACAEDCEVSAFDEWSTCDASCGGGHSRRIRAVLKSERHGGKGCPAIEQIKFCNHQPCPIDCVTSGYSSWGVCTKTCGGGLHKRALSIDVASAYGGVKCGALSESKVCNQMPCAMDCIMEYIDMEWTDCDRSCGTGYRSRAIKVKKHAKHGGKACPAERQTKTCNEAPCPSDCVLSSFGRWSACDKSCGGGTTKRSRSKLTPNTYGGRPCEHLHENQLCNAHSCPHDCETSPWSLYSECSVTCGGTGNRIRTRTVVKKATFSGAACGALTEGHVCSDGPCPIHCDVSPFTKWSKCDKQCGSGSQDRSRTVTIHAEHGGYACPALNETQNCNPQRCPVDCEVGEWGEWAACSVTCGVGEHLATRKVTTRAAHGGKACAKLTKVMACNLPDCPVDCQLSDWRIWDTCTASCGGGVQWHVRSIERSPAFGGSDCGLLQEQRVCNEQQCPIDCVVGKWTTFGGCSATCGGGSQTQTRKVIRGHDHGGALCPALDKVRVCSKTNCPVDCDLSGWSSSTPCSKSCGGGQSAKYRTVTRANEGKGKKCGVVKITKKCNTMKCPIDCVVAAWGQYSECDRSCGKGQQTRIRDVQTMNKRGGEDCPALSETRKCSVNTPCPKFCHTTEWSKWSSCTKTCGSGTRFRTRTIPEDNAPKNKNRICPNLKHTEKCNEQSCPVHCEMSEWSTWSTCMSGGSTVTCGGGVRARDRVVTTQPGYGGKKCGVMYQGEECATTTCPIHCKMHEFGNWGMCSASCGYGERKRWRSVDIKPAFGGRKCPTRSVMQGCNESPCPVDCDVSFWMSYEACTQKCGGGLHQRKRLVAMPAQYGGRVCPHTSESEECNSHPCPAKCTVTSWSTWDTCSVTCGGGVQHRTRDIYEQAKNGGAKCPTLEDDQSCNTDNCPIDCELGGFGGWGECDKSCGSGQRVRSRSIDVATAFGGKACPPLDESESCNTYGCPVDCKTTLFGRWLECTVSCGKTGYRFRYRSIKALPQLGGVDCPALTESEKCNLGFCPNDCDISTWNDWSKCSKSCGVGTQKRYRKITRKPLHGGRCPVTDEIADCNQQPCPVDCGMSDWTAFSQCTKTCGTGHNRRTRYVIVNPMWGGKGCGIHTETHRCNTQECPIDCLMHEYGFWSDCTKTCQKGRQLRTRTIWRKDVYGGIQCPSGVEERACNSFDCPVDCETSYTVFGISKDWSRWATCSRSCGIGMQKRIRSVMTRPKSGGRPCPQLEESRACNLLPCPIDCEMSVWDNWTSCSLSCGAGERKRWRNIRAEPTIGGKTCPHKYEVQSCQHISVPCPVDCVVSHYGAFSECSHTCGHHGVKTRVRTVTGESIFGGLPCPALSETVKCQTGSCPVNCDVSAWSTFGICTKKCGGGSRSRTRTISKHAGATRSVCPNTLDEEPCNEEPCTVDCVLSKFTAEWTPCSATCGTGYKHKFRTVLLAPQNGGKKCIHLDWNEPCNTKPCPADCILSEWKPWSGCSHTCGKGQQQRYRNIEQGSEFGGKPCDVTFETRRCNDFTCPVDCLVSEFGDWTACDKTCGNFGVRKRFRTINRAMEGGGRQCPKVHTEYRHCNRTPCPIDCVQEPWNQWTDCTRTCGTGHRRRSRKVIQHSRNGGVPCGVAQEVNLCNTMACATDCEMTRFGYFGECSKSCGHGSRTRTRAIKMNPTFGGARCPPVYETSYCYKRPCGIDCQVSDWSDWSQCSQPCGHGYRFSTRTVARQPALGGEACPVMERYDICMNKLWCPHDCQWEWTQWTTCSRSCGTGIRERQLSVLAEASVGGKPCPTAITEICNTHQCPTSAPTTFWSVKPTPAPAPPKPIKNRPVLTLLGGQIMYINATTSGWADLEPGAMCKDAKFGDISEFIKVEGTVDTYKSGHNELRYSCCNEEKRCAQDQIRIVIVRDHTCPTCAFSGGERFAIEASFPFNDPGLVCNDNSMTTQELTDRTEYKCTAGKGLSCNGDQPDVEAEGEYYITYRVQDANGHWNDDPRCSNPAPLVRTVTVMDTLKPVIALKYKESPHFGFLPTVGGWKGAKGLLGRENRAHLHFEQDNAKAKKAAAQAAIEQNLMEEVGSSSGTWLLAAAASAVGAVALLGFTAQRSSGARLATIV